MNDFSTKIRAELAAATVPGPDEDAASRAVRGVLRARDQRRQRLTVTAVAAVVLTTGGLTAIMRTNAPPGTSPPAASQLAQAMSWPQRGALIGDAGLIERSTEAWRQAFPQDRTTNPELLYAGHANDEVWGVKADIVVLRGTDQNGRTAVVFATTPLTNKTPDHAVMKIRARQVFDGAPDTIPVVGFVSARPLDGEQKFSTFAFALAAAGLSDVRLVSSVDAASSTDIVDGAVTSVLQEGTGRWNTSVNIRGKGSFDLAPGVNDPVVRDIKVVKGDKVTVDGQAAVGDLVVTKAGVVGIVAEGGVVDTNLERLNDLHAVDGTFEGTKYLPEPGKHPSDGGHLILDHFESSKVKISVGTIHQDSGGWQVTPSVRLPDGISTAMMISR